MWNGVIINTFDEAYSGLPNHKNVVVMKKLDLLTTHELSFATNNLLVDLVLQVNAICCDVSNYYRVGSYHMLAVIPMICFLDHYRATGSKQDD